MLSAGVSLLVLRNRPVGRRRRRRLHNKHRRTHTEGDDDMIALFICRLFPRDGRFSFGWLVVDLPRETLVLILFGAMMIESFVANDIKQRLQWNEHGPVLGLYPIRLATRDDEEEGEKKKK